MRSGDLELLKNACLLVSNLLTNPDIPLQTFAGGWDTEARGQVGAVRGVCLIGSRRMLLFVPLSDIIISFTYFLRFTSFICYSVSAGADALFHFILSVSRPKMFIYAGVL